MTKDLNSRFIMTDKSIRSLVNYGSYSEIHDNGECEPIQDGTPYMRVPYIRPDLIIVAKELISFWGPLK